MEAQAASLPLEVALQVQQLPLSPAEVPQEEELPLQLGSSLRVERELGVVMEVVPSHKRRPEPNQRWLQKWKNKDGYATCGAMYIHRRLDVQTRCYFFPVKSH